MISIKSMSEAIPEDAELVGLSISGDRDAFARIVARYQNLICSLAYSATGCLGQSEDLAQETFIIAWKHLRKLREPARLRSWLCGIARNRINQALRREGRQPVRLAGSLESIQEHGSAEAGPSEQAISREEEAILWRSLERIPELYREPLILFYREQQSAAEVAQALDLTEETVRQRLSRGRKLLQVEVMTFVEGALSRTAPSGAFTLAVIAALPLAVLPAKAVTLGAATATVQSTAAAKTGGLIGITGFAAAALGAATGGIFAIRGRIQNARSNRERRFLARASWGFLAWILFFFATIQVVESLSGGIIIINAQGAVGWSLLWVAVFGVWVAYSIWMTRKQVRIQVEEGTFEASAALRFGRVDPTRKGWRAIVYGGLASMMFGGPVAILLLVAGAVGDRLACGAVLGLVVAAWLTCAGAIMRRPERIRMIFATVWWGLALLTLSTFNLRFHSWVNQPDILWPEDPHGFHLPPAWLNIPVIAFYGSIGLAWWLERRFGLTRNVKQA